jgi:imipenem/basic amino acid-specific outer membrane pore
MFFLGIFILVGKLWQDCCTKVEFEKSMIVTRSIRSKKLRYNPWLISGFIIAFSLIINAHIVRAADIGEFELKMTTFYFDRDKGGGLPDSEALTQGFLLYYTSPYLNDFVNINVAGFTNIKLVGETGKGGTGLLQDEPDGSQSSYTKLAEINLDFKLPKNGNFIIGRKQLKYPLKRDSNNRATPALSQAAFLTYDIGNTSVYALATDRGSPKTASKFNKYQDNNGDDFTVYIAGASHTFENNLFLEASAGYADNVMTRAYFNAQYPIRVNEDVSLNFDLHQYMGWANGDGAVANVGPDYYSSLTSLVGQLSIGNARFSLGLQNVNGDSHQISWDGGVNDQNTYESWLSVSRLDFDRGGEQSYLLRLDYDLKDFLDGLKITARYLNGRNIDQTGGGTGSEWERDIILTYSPPALPNLSLAWVNEYVKSSETYNSIGNRLILNYSLKY